jgi:acetyl esterase
MIDPRAATLLAAAYRVGAPRMSDMSVEQARHAFNKLVAVYGAPAEPVASVLDVPMPRPQMAGGTLIGRLFRPHCSPAHHRLPVLLWFHGGGWTLGDVESYDPLCRALANASGAAVFSVDYRLAPEHPYPAAVEDASFALDWLAAHGADIGVDPQRIAIGGDSAGGNLSTIAAITARDAGWPHIRFQCLVYPATDMASERPSHAAHGDGFLLDESTVRWFLQCYLPTDLDRSDWRVSPLNAGWLGDLPPTLLVTAGCDPLTDDGIAYADALEAAAVTVDRIHVPGMIHGFLTLGKIFPQAGETIHKIGAALKAALAT